MSSSHTHPRKIDGTVIPAIDEKISLIPDMEKAKFFDIDTELAIR